MDFSEFLRFINEFFRSLAQFLWPIVILVIVKIFRPDISALMSRIRKGKLFGQELELDPAFQKFRDTVEEAGQEIVVSPVTEPPEEPKEEEIETEKEDLDKDVSEIFEAAKINPELGIMRLSSIIEKDLRVLAGTLDQLGPRPKVPPTQLMKNLVGKGYLPKHTNESLRMFWDLRNRIVHGRPTPDPRKILAFLDTGLSLLSAIRSIPHEINRVYYPDVDLFADSECQKRRKDVTGLILETIPPNREKVFKRIFPTKKFRYYERGKLVTWEWDLSMVWQETWYIDPDTEEKKIGWDQAAQFIGRHIDEV